MPSLSQLTTTATTFTPSRPLPHSLPTTLILARQFITHARTRRDLHRAFNNLVHRINHSFVTASWLIGDVHLPSWLDHWGGYDTLHFHIRTTTQNLMETFEELLNVNERLQLPRRETRIVDGFRRRLLGLYGTLSPMEGLEAASVRRAEANDRAYERHRAMGSRRQ